MTQGIVPYESAISTLKRHDSQRRSLTTRLAASWRPKGDKRESAAEIVHVRSGTSVNSMSVDNETHTPSVIATWALNEGEEFIRGGGEASAQHFHLVFDGVRIGFWMFPEGGDASDGMAAALVDSALQSSQAKEALVYDAIKDVMGMMKETNIELARAGAEKDKVIGQFMSQQMQYAREFAALQDQKHLRDLEAKHLDKSEARKDLAADRFIGLLDKATGIGGAAIMKKLENKLVEDDPLDKLASLLRPEEKEAFGALIRIAVARAKGETVPDVEIKVGTKPAAPAPEKSSEAEATAPASDVAVSVEPQKEPAP